MASERDIANRLPEPPAPSPEARDAAIAAALLRFDQLHPTSARASGTPPRLQAATAPPWRMRLATPAVRYLAAASVMLFIAAPAAWFSFTEMQRRDEPEFASSPAQDKLATVPPQADSPSRSVGDRGAAPAAPPSEPQPAPSQPSARQDDRSAGALGYSDLQPAPPPPARPAERSDPPADVAKAAPPAPAEPRARREPSEPLAAPPAPAQSLARPERSDPLAAPPPPRPAAPQPLARQQAPSAGASGGQGDWAACRTGDTDRKIVGCTRIIEDQARGTSDRRAALLERGQALAQRGELDRAIADFTEAIRLDPANAASFYNRSLAYRAKGEIDRADADLARARSLGWREAPSIELRWQGSR